MDGCNVSKDDFCNGVIKCAGLSPCTVGCPSYFLCRTNICVKRDTVCDGIYRTVCPEDDEWQTGIGFKCMRNQKTCHLPQQLLYDTIQECDNGEDLCFEAIVNSAFKCVHYFT